MTFSQYIHDPVTWVALGLMFGIVALVAGILWGVCVGIDE